MRRSSEPELEAAEGLLIELEQYYDDSDETLEPIVPGHAVHVAVGNWRQSLPKNNLTPEFSRLRALLWKLSKVDREEAKSAAEDFAELLIRRYPSLKNEKNDESCIDAGQWFDSPPVPDSPFQFGPINGQMEQLARWMASGDPRTLKKHNGKGYYITKVHGRQFWVWFSSQDKFQHVQRQQRAENA